jgi:hypothetical protein
MKISKLYTYRRALRTILAGAACGSIALAALMPEAALAAPEGKLESMSLDLSVPFQGPSSFPSEGGGGLIVISDDEVTWNRFLNAPVVLGGTVHIEMSRGRIKNFGIYWGACNGHDCFSPFAVPGTPLLASTIGNAYKKEINKTVNFSFPASIIPPSGAGPGISLGDQIIAKCNAALAEGKTIEDGHAFTFPVPLTLGVDTMMWKGAKSGTQGGGTISFDPAIAMSDVDFEKTVHVNMPVTCQPVPKKILPPLELLSASFAVSHGYYQGTCPVDVHLLGGAITNISGPIEVQIESKSRGKSKKQTYTTTTENANGTWQWTFEWLLEVPVVAQSGGGGAGGAGQAAVGGLGTLPKPEEPLFPGSTPQIDQTVATGYNPPNVHEDSLRLIVTGNGKTITTPWRKYKVTCDPKKNPAVGDVPTGVQTSAFVKQAQLWLTPVAPMDGAKCGVQAHGFIETNVNTKVKFRLTNHQGNTTNWQTVQTKGPMHVGQFSEYLDWSSKDEGVWVTPDSGWALPGAGVGSQAGKKTGTLQIVTETPTKFEGNMASYDFTCHDPAPTGIQTNPTVQVNPDLPKGPSSVVDTGKPSSGNPDNRVEQPVPPITCLGGKVRGGKCLCGGGTVVIGGLIGGKPTKFRCVAKPKPELVKPSAIAPLPKLTCAGGKAIKGECVCGKGLTPVKAGKSDLTWRCNKVVADPPRDKGSANKVQVKTAPKKTATPKLSNSKRGKDGKGKGKTAKKENGSSAVR